MSRYFSRRYQGTEPYIPGEQPQDKSYIKLNTNELPYPPSPLAQKLARQQAGELNLYSDPDCKLLRATAAEFFGIDAEEIMFGNGSDELLNYCVMAFCDEERKLAFPEVTYSFYQTIAKLNRIPFEMIPLQADLSIDVNAYLNIGRTIIIANPNAPTGIALNLSEIEKILVSNKDNVVIIDEAYVDFGRESALPLVDKYDNLLIVRTFSKSGGLAGGRLGYVMGNKELISDLNTLRNANNPYNINRMTMMAGVGIFTDPTYLSSCVDRIRQTREETANRLKQLGFEMTPSQANFLFVKHQKYDGLKLYQDLKERGILIRHFETELLHDYNRISIGSAEDMDKVITVISELLGAKS